MFIKSKNNGLKVRSCSFISNIASSYKYNAQVSTTHNLYYYNLHLILFYRVGECLLILGLGYKCNLVRSSTILPHREVEFLLQKVLRSRRSMIANLFPIVASDLEVPCTAVVAILVAAYSRKILLVSKMPANCCLAIN
jgi:hypothetical protein